MRCLTTPARGGAGQPFDRRLSSRTDHAKPLDVHGEGERSRADRTHGQAARAGRIRCARALGHRRDGTMKPWFLLGILASTACVQAADSSTSDPLANLDIGDVAHFQSCKAPIRRSLSDYEMCLRDALANRCSPADDCLVTCISSPQGHLVGGGCAHVCFSSLHSSEPPPADIHKCDELKR